MNQISIRDLNSYLGEVVESAKDMEALIEVRLKMSATREATAQAVAKAAEKNYSEATAALAQATRNHAYWEEQLQKIRERNQPTTATESPATAMESRTFVVHTNGVSMEEIDQLIQEKATKAFKDLEAEGRAVFE